MSRQPAEPGLPEGIDGPQYERLRALMRMAVLLVWRGANVVVAGTDPLDVVDEAWSSMAAKDFKCKGPFVPFALRVAKNKAIDALKRAEVKRIHVSLDAPLASDESDGTESTLHEVVGGGESAEDEYLEEEDEAAQEIEKLRQLTLAEDAIFTALSEEERSILLAVHRDGRSRAAVGRERIPPVSGQWVGRIIATAIIKVRDHIKEQEQDGGEEQ